MPSGKSKERKKKGTRGTADSSSEDEEIVEDKTAVVATKPLSKSKLKALAKEKETLREKEKEKGGEGVSQVASDAAEGGGAASGPLLMPLPAELLRDGIGSKKSNAIIGKKKASRSVTMRDEGFIDTFNDDDNEDDDYEFVELDPDDEMDKSTAILVNRGILQNSDEGVLEDNNKSVSIFALVDESSESESDNAEDTEDVDNNVEDNGSGSSSSSNINENSNNSNSDGDNDNIPVPPPAIIANLISYHPRLCSFMQSVKFNLSEMISFLQENVQSNLESVPGVDSHVVDVLDRNEISSPFQLIGKFLSFRRLLGLDAENDNANALSHIENFWIWVKDLFMAGDEPADFEMIFRLSLIVRAIAFKADIIFSGLYCEDKYSATLPESLLTSINGRNAALIVGNKSKKLVRNNDPVNNVPQAPISVSADAISYLAKCESICVDMCAVGGVESSSQLIQVICGLVSSDASFKQDLMMSNDCSAYESILKLLENVLVEGSCLISNNENNNNSKGNINSGKTKEIQELITSLTETMEAVTSLLVSLCFDPITIIGASSSSRSTGPSTTFRQNSISSLIPVVSHSRLCQSLVGVLLLYKHSVRMSESICTMFSYLTYNNNENRILLGDGGICEVLIDVLQLHITNAPQVVETTCRAIGNICYNDENKKKIGKFGTCKLLSQVLVVYKRLAPAVDAASLAICNLSYKSEGNQQKFRECGCCELLVEVLSIHKQSVQVAEQICRSIVNLAFNGKNKALLKKVGALVVLNDAASIHGPALAIATEAQRRINQ